MITMGIPEWPPWANSIDAGHMLGVELDIIRHGLDGHAERCETCQEVRRLYANKIGFERAIGGVFGVKKV